MKAAAVYIDNLAPYGVRWSLREDVADVIMSEWQLPLHYKDLRSSSSPSWFALGQAACDVTMLT